VNAPQPATTKVTLPAGVLHEGDVIEEVLLREMGGDEERILGSKNPDMERIVNNCIMQVGPVADPATLRRDVIPNMRIGDYNTLILHLRRLSLGDEYAYQAKCPSCQRQDTYTVDLSSVDVVRMRDPGTDAQPYVLRSGAEAIFRPVLVKDRKMLEDIGEKGQDVLGKSLAMRLVSIDGAEPDPGKNANQRLKNAVKMLRQHVPSYGEREAIRKWFNTTETIVDDNDDEILVGVDASIDTVVEDRCSCGTGWKHRFAIDPSFMMPSSAG